MGIFVLIFGLSKAPLNLAVQLGLIKSKSHNKYFDLFRNRLMFPIVSHRGDVVGFEVEFAA